MCVNPKWPQRVICNHTYALADSRNCQPLKAHY